MWKKLPDSILVGFFSGFITLGIFYFLLSSLRSLITDYYQNEHMFAAPKVQLFSIFLNLVLFRFIMVRTDKEKLGKGILLTTVGTSFIYFYFFLRYHQSIFGS